MNYRAEVSASADLFEVHRRAPERYPFLLESVAGHPLAGRYDILFAVAADAAAPQPDTALFERLTACARQAPVPPSDLPFCGGWFVYLGYEAAAQVEPRLRLPPSPFQLARGHIVRCPAAIIHDRQQQRCILVAEDSAVQLEAMRADLLASLKNVSQPIEYSCVHQVDEDPDRRFVEGVERILDYLRAGDTFQVNLSRAWRARLRNGVGYTEVYRALRRTNPAPFAGLARTTVISSSPERRIQIRGRTVQTRPIAGTRPRGVDPAEDQRLRARLVDSIKERAEHIMLIDLERNDLGRVCRAGSIEVSELMAVESYAHVHHIVSNVRGQLRDSAGAGDAVRAVFPGGTITGCPKVRAMEIIAELEGVGRGPYTGSMGYLSRCGQMDLNILIRSLVIEDGTVSFRAGAGIVADSEPLAELAETRSKARGLLRALGAP
jgi:anthranilate synthase component I